MIVFLEKNGPLEVEVNNYLYFLNKVCLDNKDIRRYANSILRLYDKLNTLPVDYNNTDMMANRTFRKSSRYVSKIRKNVKKIKSIDSDVFKEAADKLYEKNSFSDEYAYVNRYSKNGWDSDQISRTIMSDISGLIKLKRRNYLSSNDTINENFSNGDNFSSFSSNEEDFNNIELLDVSDEESNKDLPVDGDNQFELLLKNNEDDNVIYLEDKEPDYVERNLIKKELIELKKEIDQKEELFIDVDHISDEQKNVIKSYISICDKYEEIDKLFHYIYDESSSNNIVSIYEKIYEFTGFLISEMFEHIIHLSKVLCEFNNKSGLYEEKYLMDRSVVEVFGKYDLFIAKIQNFVKLLNEKQGDTLSSSDKERLSKILWDKYRLDDINPSSIKEAVSLDLMSFINENPFTLVQTIPYSKRNKESYKKYDLNKILENVDFCLEKYIPELVKSIKNKIMNDSLLNDGDKEYVITNIIRSFSKFIGDIHGISEFPAVSYNYLINYIMNKVFLYDSDIDAMYKDCVQKMFSEQSTKYKSLSFFEKFMYSKEKPNISIIENKIKNFTDRIDNISFSAE